MQEAQLTCTCLMQPRCMTWSQQGTDDKECMDPFKFSAEESFVADLCIFFFPGGGGVVAEHLRM